MRVTWHDAAGHSSRHALDLKFQPWLWRSPTAGAPTFAAHFAVKQREKPKMWNGPILLARNRFTGNRFSASYFDIDFASFLAWRDWGFPDKGFSTASGWARCAALMAHSCWANEPAYRECRAHLLSIGNA